MKSEIENILRRMRVNASLSESDCIIIEQEILDLELWKRSYLGYWIMDKNPKEVSKEWIEKNAFQLK
jgi:hypothetical protein